MYKKKRKHAYLLCVCTQYNITKGLKLIIIYHNEKSLTLKLKLYYNIFYDFVKHNYFIDFIAL